MLEAFTPSWLCDMQVMMQQKGAQEKRKRKADDAFLSGDCLTKYEKEVGPILLKYGIFLLFTDENDTPRRSFLEGQA